MRSGALREAIEVNEPPVKIGENRAGEPIYSPATWRDLFAEVIVRRGTEFVDKHGDQKRSRVLYRFRCRREDVDDVDETRKIRFEGDEYDITAVLPDYEDRQYIVLECNVIDG